MVAEQEHTRFRSEFGGDNSTTVDLLGYRRLAEPIAQKIANAKPENTPLTIGVYGEWGSGKTSFLKMIDESLTAQGIRPIWFNAWKYEQEENLWSALIETILTHVEISGQWYRHILVRLRIWRQSITFRAGTWSIAKKLLPILFRTVIFVICVLLLFGWSSTEIESFLTQNFAGLLASNPRLLPVIQLAIRAFLGLIAFLVTKPEELWKFISGAKLGMDFSKFKNEKGYKPRISFLDEFSEQFQKIVKLVGGGKPLVVVIDDLDRCLPEKAIQVLEAIKLFLDVQGCIFLLAVERDVVEKAIVVKYKDIFTMAKDMGTDTNALFTRLGENYFEKIVQLPITLPPISDAKFTEFISKVYPDADIEKCAVIFADSLPRNPRKVKRLLQTFLFLRDLAAEDIQSSIIVPSLIAKVLIVQNFFKQVFQDLPKHPSLLQELERVYRTQSQPLTTLPIEESPFSDISDAILQQKVESYVTLFPQLRRVLIQQISAEDTFVGVNLEPYLSLTKPIVEVQYEAGTPTQGEPSASAIPIPQYVSQLLARFTPISLGPTSGSVKSGMFEQMYVSPTLSPRDKSDEKLAIADVLSGTLRLIIMSEPGSGKTALLTYIAQTFARAMLQGNPQLSISKLGIAEQLIPIFFPLREFGNYLERHPHTSPTPQLFLDFLDEYFERWNIGIISGSFQIELDKGNCILLLDGLDEISEPSVRQLVLQTIQSVAQRYTLVRIVVTSRPAGLVSTLNLPNFPIYKINNLSEAESQKLLQRLLQNFPRDLSPSLQKKVEELLDTNSEIATLVQNPLVLTLILNVFSSTNAVPKRQIDLYDVIIDFLLDTWDKARGIGERGKELPLSLKKRMVSTLAWEALEERRTVLERDFIVNTLQRELKNSQSSEIEVQIYVETIIDEFRSRSGLLVEVGPNAYAFVHRVFQEVLAAYSFANNPDAAEFILENYKDMYWHEVFVFAIDKMGKKYAQNIVQELLNTESEYGLLIVAHLLIQSDDFGENLRQDVLDRLQTLLKSSTKFDDGVKEQLRNFRERLLQKVT